MANQITIKRLECLEGLSVKDVRRMPHPLDLRRWSDAGLYLIDVDMGVFRLTQKGLDQIAVKSSLAA